MKRRAFVGTIARALLALPLAVEAQQARGLPRVGYLVVNSAAVTQRHVAAFKQGMREHGWVEGQNFLFEIRYADGRVDRLPALVAELIGLKVDIIVATSSATTWAAKKATASIPIVMGISADALGEGLVANLAHPGGNITGMTYLVGPEIAGKHLELLKTLVPTASRIAVLANPVNRSHANLTRELRAAAGAFGVQLQVFEAQAPGEIDAAFAAMTRDRAAALLVLTDSVFVGHHVRVTDLAARNRMPTMYYQREFVEAGGLISYGASLLDMYRRAATHVDKILKGANPADLPIEQPTTFELVINLKTAKALGLSIPQSLLLRADEVIK